jgi:hypothetical protein
MRVPLLLLASILALAACKNNDQVDNTQNVDENLTAENIVSNDVTAIDAVTGDAANMAADSDMNFGNLDENVGNQPMPTEGAKPAPKAAAPKKARPAQPAAAPATSNTVGNAE